jgi:F-type H+-transporting ATPase subunit a
MEDVLFPIDTPQEHTEQVQGTSEHAGSEAIHSEAQEHAASGIEVNLKSHELGNIAGIPVTNTLLTSLTVSVLLMVFGYFFSKSIKVIPGKTQLFFEELISYFQDFFEKTLEDRKLALKYLPFLLTIFIFVSLCNLMEFLPGVGSIGFFGDHGFVSLFHSVNTDLNMTIALTLISVITVEVAGIMALGFFQYAHKFINFTSPINFFVGIVELVSELARLVSFSFRLFGNIFAGQVLIAVVTFFVPYILPVPLMAFEMFVGIVQAAIFMMLTLFFIKLAITPHGGEEHSSTGVHAEPAHAQ